MRTLTWLVGEALTGAASTAGAQPVPQSHEQHQAAGQHQVAESGEKCCCEEMMRKMMMEMMRKDRGMGTESSQEGPQPEKKHEH